MSNRPYRQLQTQGTQHIQYNFSLLGQGAAAPKLNEGDAGGAYIVSPIVRNSQGNYSFTTVDPFLAVVNVDANYMAATVTTSWGFTWGLPSQNSTTFVWTFNFVAYVSNTGTATDIILNDKVGIQITFRNSVVLP